ncbi:ImmA/IrrE family metallo-endopeptidase [Actinoplanes palleronii]|uniref:IrrE N-terminal-like domain-containing protein n=1 Tax=Actinoplanes palleronii TaxID=113570 RepID=A0ABQ4B1D4_9ACTN|nr:ImmA/IrrE family metallo-endopeptidase [Actinoplanes palleronii]GIE64476.1 hypothetical protein Apa02nite_005840 [Actinoplanes palleronii]
MSPNEQHARQLAEAFRAEHGLDDTPIKDMHELVHVTKGIDVISMPVPDAEHGLSMHDPATGRVVIAVATTAHPMRQRSSIAHELGHVVAGDLERDTYLAPGERSPEEIRADAFARHLLLPLGGVRQRFPTEATEGVTLSVLSDLVQEFEVSPPIAAIQLRTLGLIDAATCTTWSAKSAANLATTFGWGSQYRSLTTDSTAPRAPQSLMARAVEGYQRGVLGITELAAWYGQDATELQKELGPPQSPDEDDEWDDDAPLFTEDGWQEQTS